ncbi:MAG TPA: trypsin-like peptidase domain-containing protein [Pyrinomonadaceae bacterium]|nr:trypsin-like peptidase domain-containing protein [Pyrinomonadaceae bacterium]
MAVGIIIHVSVGAEKRTEIFTDKNIRIGSTEENDLQIHHRKIVPPGVWLDLELSGDVYRVINFDVSLNLLHNGKPIRQFVALDDGDTIKIPDASVLFSFFSLESKSSLITTNRGLPHVAPFIEAAAMESGFSPKRDDAKVFLREFVRELLREVSWVTKLIVLAIVVGSISGIFYLGAAFNTELQKNRRLAEQQNEIVRQLQERIAQTNDQIGEIDKSNKSIIKNLSSMQNIRGEYGNGVCLIVGVYDLVDRKNGKTLRYPDPQAFEPSPYEPAEETPPASEDGAAAAAAGAPMGLTTEGGGSPVEYDFIGTGFHVGGGYIVTNRHVLQPWEEEDLVKQMMTQANGRARVKRLVIYFPNFPQPFPLKLRQLGAGFDLAIGSIDTNLVSPDIPVLPLEVESDAVSVGRTVVTMGYPNGPDRLLAMVDDTEAKSINARFGGSRQGLINFLAQSRKIVPLTTQGAITDLDPKRIVHDAKTAEGGSGAPLFGQTGKVIGVNFGVFTESTAANMALPIRFAIDLLKKVGWKSPEELKAAAAQSQTASANTNTAAR